MRKNQTGRGVIKIEKNYTFLKYLGMLCVAFFLNFIFLNNIYAQQEKSVSGKVTDSSGIPLPGVTIVIIGTTQGTVTDTDGGFSFLKLNNDVTLQFSFIGMKTQEVKVDGQEIINIVMSEESFGLNEVVAIGYGTTSKKEVTGSISTVSKENFKTGAISNPLELLQGQVAGLNIVKADGGDPNGEMEIQLRGLTTLAGGASPLIVIDGVIGGSLSNLSPDVIESIDVLKDGSAAAIYGTRGTNGVILVTTKKAEPGKTKVDFSTYVSIQSVAKKLDVLTAEGFRQVIDDYYPTQKDAFDYGYSTDWFSEVTRKTPASQYYNLSASGGSEQFSYLASISWQEDKGLVKKSVNNRLKANININQKGFNNRLNLDYRLSYSTGQSNYTDQGVLQQAARRNPTEPVYDYEDETPISGGWYYNDGPFQYYNPVAMLEESEDEGDIRNFSGSINASFRIYDDLKVNTLVSLIQTNDRYGHYYGRYYPINFGTNGTADVYNNSLKTKLLEFSLDYHKNIEDHNIQRNCWLFI